MAMHEADYLDEHRHRRSGKPRDFDADEAGLRARDRATAAMAPVPLLDWPSDLFLDADAADGDALGHHAVLLVFGVPDRAAIDAHRRTTLGIARPGMAR